jgi:hypothetical protein
MEAFSDILKELSITLSPNCKTAAYISRRANVSLDSRKPADGTGYN